MISAPVLVVLTALWPDSGCTAEMRLACRWAGFRQTRSQNGVHPLTFFRGSSLADQAAKQRQEELLHRN